MASFSPSPKRYLRRLERGVRHGVKRGLEPVKDLGGAVAHELGDAVAGIPGAVKELGGVVVHLPEHVLHLDPNLLSASQSHRTSALNWQLAGPLAFVAGAVNAGGFLAVGRYTSHVTGAVSQMADGISLGKVTVALGAFGVVLAFFLGAFASSFFISLAERHRFRSRYAITLGIEAVLLLVFGYLGASIATHTRFAMPATVTLLSFTMGMHNAIVTNISQAEVRTTHMTGILTDLGIETSRLLYLNRDPHPRLRRIVANRTRLKLHATIFASFFVGGLLGALAFSRVGYKASVPLAILLLFLAISPLLHELKARFRLLKQGWRRG